LRPGTKNGKTLHGRPGFVNINLTKDVQVSGILNPAEALWIAKTDAAARRGLPPGRHRVS